MSPGVRYEFVSVAPRDVRCPSCRSTSLRTIEQVIPTAPAAWCPACGRTDVHYRLTCDDCGRVWDIGDRPMFDGLRDRVRKRLKWLVGLVE